MWGLNITSDILTVFYIAMGLVYPLSEHVDIFPVRPVPTFPLSILRLPYSNHLSYMVVFILAGGIKDKGWILFLLSIKIHYIFISDMERSTIVIQQLIL
jgi:hypothetical protein